MYDIEQIEEFQLILGEILKRGILDFGLGLCGEAARSKLRRRLVGFEPYDIMADIVDDDGRYVGGVEPRGFFGPIRQTLAMFIVTMPSEDLLEIVNAPARRMK